MQPTLLGTAEPDGEATAELAADMGHGRPDEGPGLLEAQVVDLQPGDLAVPPAADDHLGDLLRSSPAPTRFLWCSPAGWPHSNSPAPKIHCTAISSFLRAATPASCDG